MSKKTETATNSSKVAPMSSQLHDDQFERYDSPDGQTMSHLIGQKLKSNSTDQSVTSARSKVMADYDPAKCSNMVEQAEADLTLQSSVLTPHDQAFDCQAITNPHPEHRSEMITVRMVKPNLLHTTFDKEHPNLSNPDWPQCKEIEHRLTPVEGKPKKSKKPVVFDCDFCGKIMNESDSFHQCAACKIDCCSECMLSTFVRRQLEKKSDKHHYYEPMVIQEKVATSPTLPRASMAEKSLSMVPGMTGHLESETIYPLIPDAEWSPDKAQSYPHAIVGFWKKDTVANQMICYRQFRINRPVVLFRRGKQTQLQRVLHVTPDNRFFYLKQTGSLANPDIKFCEIDLHKACSTAPENLEEFTRNVKKLPRIGQDITFTGDAKKFLKHLYFDFEQNKNQVLSLPHLAGSLLLIAAPFKVGKNGKYEDEKKQNMFTIDLTNPRDVQFRAEVSSILSVRAEGNVLTDLWYAYQTKIVNLKGAEEREYPFNTRVDFFKEKQELQGRIYKNFEFVTIAYKEKNNKSNYKTYKLSYNEAEGKGKANLHAEGTSSPQEIRLCKMIGEDMIYVCGSLALKEHTSEDLMQDPAGFHRYKIDKIDPTIKTNPKQQAFEVLIHRNFKKYDRADKSRHDHLLTDFYCWKDGDHVRLQAGIFYSSADQQVQRMQFLIGKDNTSDMLDNPTLVKTQEKIVDYPIMACTSPHPMGNKLLISNMANNVPQKLIDLSTFRFVCFVESAAPQVARPHYHNVIFFLAREDEDKRLSLFCYQTYPWPSINDAGIRREPDCIKRIGDYIDLDEAAHTDTIIKAILIASEANLKSIQLRLIIEFEDKIEIKAPFNNTKYQQQLILPANTELLPLTMVCSQQSQVYFALRYPTGDAIMCLALRQTTIEQTNIYETRQQILQVQIQNDTLPETFGDHSIFVLESSKLLHEISCSGWGKKLSEQIFDIKKTYPIGNMTALFDSLTNFDQQELVITQRAIVSHLGNEENESSGAVCYNVASGTRTAVPYLNYDVDDSIRSMAKGVPKSKLKKDKQCASVQTIPGIAKTLYQFTNGSFCYHLCVNSEGSRRNDMMSYFQQNELATASYGELLLLGTQIAVKMPGQYLFFNQSDFMFNSVRKLEEIRMLNTAYDGGAQYAFFNYGKNNYDIVRCDEDGQFPVIRKDKNKIFQECKKKLDKYFQSTKEEAKTFNDDQKSLSLREAQKQKDAEDYKIPRLVPEFYVSNKGEVIQVYFVSLKKELEEGPQNNEDAFFFQYQFTDEEQDGRTEIERSSTVYVAYSPMWQDMKTARFLVSDRQLSFKNGSKVLAIDRESCKQSSEQAESILRLSRGEMDKEEVCARLLRDGYSCRYKTFEVSDNLQQISQVFDTTSNIDENLARLQKAGMEMSKNTIEVFDFNQCFNQRIIDQDFKLYCIDKDDILMPPDDKARCGQVVQLMFKEDSLLSSWDDGGEIRFFHSPGHFDRPETYVHLGCKINVTDTSQSTIKKAVYVLQNDERSLFVRPAIPGLKQVAQLFRLFTMVDIYELTNLQLREARREVHADAIDPETILCYIYGRTFFQIFHNCGQLFNNVHQQVVNMRLTGTRDENGQDFDNIYIRRLYHTLEMPLVNEEHHATECSLVKKHYMLNQWQKPKFTCKNALQNYLHATSAELGDGVLDALFKLLLLSSEVRMSNVVQEFNDFKRTFDVTSDQIKNFMQAVFYENEQTRRVTSMMWDIENPMMVIGQNFCQFSEKYIVQMAQDYITRQNKKWYTYRSLKRMILGLFGSKAVNTNQFVQVKVSIIEIGWVSRKWQDLYSFMAGYQDVSVYDNELIKVLLGEQDYTNQLFWKAAVPYLLYFCSMILYYTEFLVRPHYMYEQQEDWVIFLQATSFLLGVCFLFLEIIELRQMGWAYMLDFWNSIDLSSNLLNIALLIEARFQPVELSHQHLVKIVAVAVILMWIKIFYWLRLSRATAFYVTMIKETIVDILSFLVLLVVTICLFTNATYVLDIDRPDSNLITGHDWRSRLMGTFVAQYRLTLGDFDVDAYEQSESPNFLWILFFCATLISQITMLNMLIAIMGDTYDKVSENKKRYSLQQQTEAYADFIQLLSFKSRLKDKRYAYVIQRINEDQADEWQGSLTSIKQQLHVAEDRIMNMVRGEVRTTNEELRALRASNEHQTKDIQQLRSQLDKFVDGIDKIVQAGGTDLRMLRKKSSNMSGTNY